MYIKIQYVENYKYINNSVYRYKMKPVWCSNVEKPPVPVVNEVKIYTIYNKVYFRDVINEHTM